MLRLSRLNSRQTSIHVDVCSGDKLDASQEAPFNCRQTLIVAPLMEVPPIPIALGREESGQAKTRLCFVQSGDQKNSGG